MTDFPILFDKLEEFVESKNVGEQFKDICNVIIDINELRKKIVKNSESKKMKKEKQALKDKIGEIYDYLD
ncbi:MAG: hypothetical protein K8S18_09555 [Desulfobacula sp.]|nr:hypothetical protein [Desulfobacula sp.]